MEVRERPFSPKKSRALSPPLGKWPLERPLSLLTPPQTNTHLTHVFPGYVGVHVRTSNAILAFTNSFFLFYVCTYVMHMQVYVCLCVCYVCVCRCVLMYTPRSTPGPKEDARHPDPSIRFIPLRKGLLVTEQELGRQPASPAILLSPPSQPWGYRHPRSHTQPLAWVLKSLCLYSKGSYPQSHLPTP